MKTFVKIDDFDCVVQPGRELWWNTGYHSAPATAAPATRLRHSSSCHAGPCSHRTAAHRQ